MHSSIWVQNPVELHNNIMTVHVVTFWIPRNKNHIHPLLDGCGSSIKTRLSPERPEIFHKRSNVCYPTDSHRCCKVGPSPHTQTLRSSQVSSQMTVNIHSLSSPLQITATKPGTRYQSGKSPPGCCCHAPTHGKWRRLSESSRGAGWAVWDTLVFTDFWERCGMTRCPSTCWEAGWRRQWRTTRLVMSRSWKL